MNGPKLPTVRLPAVSGGEPVILEPVILDHTPSNGLIVSYASETSRSVPGPSVIHSSIERPTLGSSDGDHIMSEGESVYGESGGEEGDYRFSGEAPQSSTSTAMRPPPRPGILHSRTQLSRTLSMPLPSQLNHLRHPHRPGPLRATSFTSSSKESSHLQDLSMELADSVQMAIQTMLQVSPAQIFDPAKEQFSACSLSVPTSSMSAIFTAMKNLNYISANIASFTGGHGLSSIEELPKPPIPDENVNDFDIGEMLQSVGDGLSGAAAHAGVDLVLYHGDAGLKHVFVSGNESAISYALSHVIRQVLNSAECGDSIELGLLVGPSVFTLGDYTSASISNPLDSEDDSIASSPTDADGTLRCVFRITHKFGSPDSPTREGEPIASMITRVVRPDPSFNSVLLRRLLHQIGGSLNSDVPFDEGSTVGRVCDLGLTLERGAKPAPTPLVELPEDEPFVSEPTIEQLAAFIETLKGKRVTLYASAKGSFAQHITSYLTAWGMDVTHVSPDGNTDGVIDPSPDDVSTSSTMDSRISPTIPSLSTYGANTEPTPPSGVPSNVEARQSGSDPLSFVFVDDDVNVLKERLNMLHAELQPSVVASTMRKRPALITHHRKSSPQITRLRGHSTTSLMRPPPVVIVHFTSLSNYKLIKDVIQSVMVTYGTTSTPLPEVMILPKPAGPRRFLTALHTAVTKPTVDPFFSPIATSPMSPSVHHSGSFFHSYHEANAYTSSSMSGRPSGTRSNSDTSSKSGKDGLDHVPTHPAPVSPLGLPDNVEYFSEAAKQIGSSPSSGFLIQSPDGQTTGIYFPRTKTSRTPSNQSVEKAKGTTTSVPRQVSAVVSRVPSNGNGKTISFSSLGAPQTPSSPAVEVKSPVITSPIAAPRKPSSPRGEIVSKPLTSPPRRFTAEIPRRSPPVSPGENGASSRRALSKRPDLGTGISLKKVLGATDGNVVPPISVLIVDDNNINQTILSTFMRKKKIKYDIAKNGLEAVQKWKTGGFHLILMDIQMPVMDGIEATKEIRRLESTMAFGPLTPSEGVRTPSGASSCTSPTDSRPATSPFRSSVIIVALTASSLQSDRVAALAAGCNDFLTKPVSLHWLNSKIIEWGSIKALQMWDTVRSFSNTNAARNVAERLHVPQGRATPPTTSVKEESVSPATPIGSGPSGLSMSITPSIMPIAGPVASSELASGVFLASPSTSKARAFPFPTAPSRSDSLEGRAISTATEPKPVSTSMDVDGKFASWQIGSLNN
ncbi:hypothetical protein BDQ17DRAFT_1240903 [Cyathus striatus]|nr:hypothetical protein BDQ17DRAFT_1240903 [Cyathus striatus]